MMNPLVSTKTKIPKKVIALDWDDTLFSTWKKSLFEGVLDFLNTLNDASFEIIIITGRASLAEITKVLNDVSITFIKKSNIYTPDSIQELTQKQLNPDTYSKLDVLEYDRSLRNLLKEDYLMIDDNPAYLGPIADAGYDTLQVIQKSRTNPIPVKDFFQTALETVDNSLAIAQLEVKELQQKLEFEVSNPIQKNNLELALRNAQMVLKGFNVRYIEEKHALLKQKKSPATEEARVKLLDVKNERIQTENERDAYVLLLDGKNISFAIEQKDAILVKLLLEGKGAPINDYKAAFNLAEKLQFWDGFELLLKLGDLKNITFTPELFIKVVRADKDDIVQILLEKSLISSFHKPEEKQKFSDLCIRLADKSRNNKMLAMLKYHGFEMSSFPGPISVAWKEPEKFYSNNNNSTFFQAKPEPSLLSRISSAFENTFSSFKPGKN